MPATLNTFKITVKELLTHCHKNKIRGFRVEVISVMTNILLVVWAYYVVSCGQVHHIEVQTRYIENFMHRSYSRWYIDKILTYVGGGIVATLFTIPLSA